MANIKTLSKAALGTVVAGAMLTATATPAAAQWNRYDRNRDGIGVGEVIAGAVILGGLAAILSSGNNRDRYDERTYGDGYDGYGYDYNRYGNSRQAVNQCVSAVQQRVAYDRRGGNARVDQITRIDRNSKGYTVEGRISVNDRYGYNNRYDNGRYNDRYGDYRYGDRYDNRRYDDRYSRGGYDTGSFSCSVKYGRIDKLKVRGV